MIAPFDEDIMDKGLAKSKKRAFCLWQESS